MTKPIKLSEGLRESFKFTNCKMANRTCYGYTATQKCVLVVNDVKAAIVKWILDRYLSGDSLGKISAGLENQGILSPAGKAKWNRKAISKLLFNEKYTGLVLPQKTLSFCGTLFQKDGKLERVLIRGHHAAIISVLDFEKIQQMKTERSKAPAQDCSMNLLF